MLELSPEASEDQARHAYITLVKVWHPDRFEQDTAVRAKAEQKLKEINEAYAVLSGATGAAPRAPAAVTLPHEVVGSLALFKRPLRAGDRFFGCAGAAFVIAIILGVLAGVHSFIHSGKSTLFDSSGQWVSIAVGLAVIGAIAKWLARRDERRRAVQQRDADCRRAVLNASGSSSD